MYSFGSKRYQEEKSESKATRESLQGRKRSIQIPSFYGKINSDAYLKWEKEMELVFSCHNIKEKKVQLAVTGFCGYALTWWIRDSKTRRFNGEPHVSSWLELKKIMKKRFLSRSYDELELDSRSNYVRENKPKEEDPWSYSKLLEVLKLNRKRTKLEKSSDQEEQEAKAEQIEQSDHEEVSQIQGIELPATMVKIQHELNVQSEETQQEEVDSKVETQKERKEATMKNMLLNKTRSMCDDLSKRYFLLPDHYIPCFELLKGVDYGKRKFCDSGDEFQGSYLEGIKFCNFEIYEKKQAVDYVFGESAFGNTEAKAQTWLFERGKGFQILWSFKEDKLVDFCYKKAYQNELQNQDACSLQFMKFKVGPGAPGINPVIDKVRNGRGVTKFKKLSREQWRYDKGESVELFTAPQQFPFEVGEMSDLRSNLLQEGEDDVILINKYKHLIVWFRQEETEDDEKAKRVLIGLIYAVLDREKILV